MTGEPTHTTSKERMAPVLMFSSEHTSQLSKTASKVQWPSHFDFSYVQPITQRHRRKTVEEVPLQQSSHHENTTIHAPPTINYCLVSAAAITLRFQPCSASYTALQTKNSVRIISAINPVTTENTDDSRLQTYCREAMHRTTTNRHLWLSAKRKWDTKEDKGKSMMHVLYILRYAKGMSWDEATLNSKKIKSIALAIIELHFPEGIRQAVLVSRKFH